MERRWLAAAAAGGCGSGAPLTRDGMRDEQDIGLPSGELGLDVEDNLVFLSMDDFHA